MPAEAPLAPPAPAHAEAARPRDSQRFYYSVFAVALAAAVIPFWLVRFPAMMDYHAHLVRCYILAHYHANPLWQHTYRLALGPIPNLAIDAIVTPLAHWLPLVLSGKIFLTLTALLYVGGCDALGRALWGNRHWMALIAAFTFFNTNLLDGRVNYIFGVALAFWVLALWLRWRSRVTLLRFALLGLLGVLVYLAHLGAIAILGVACTTMALLDFACHRRLTRLAAEAGWLACPTLLLIFGYLHRSGRVGALLWGSWQAKAAHLLTLIRTYDLRLDALLLLGLALCAGVLLSHARWNRGTAIAGLVLLTCYVVTPSHIFTADYADARFVLPGFVLLILAVQPRSGRLRNLALAAVMLLFTVRVVYIAHTWIALQPEAGQIVAMGNAVPAGSRVDVADNFLGKSGASGFRRLVLSHLLTYWSVSRGVYMANVFAQAGQQPLVQRPSLAKCWPGEQPGCLAHFDYVVTDEPPPPVATRLRAAAVPIRRVGTFVLWRTAAPATRPVAGYTFRRGRRRH